jgi:hypothetical protein
MEIKPWIGLNSTGLLETKETTETRRAFKLFPFFTFPPFFSPVFSDLSIAVSIQLISLLFFA